MTQLIEIPLKEGGIVIMEVERSAVGGSTRRLGISEITANVTQTFEDALDKIKLAAGVVITKLRELQVQPDQIGVEFGIKMSGDAKAYIASASAEANFKVTLIWKREQ
jgi:hypothetical protein